MTGDASQWNVPNDEDRFTATIQKAGNILQLTTSGENASLVWNNGDGTQLWNEKGDQNWLNQNKQDKFFSGDAVIFNGLGQGDVEVVQDVYVSKMEISNGTYHFTGNNIYGEKGDLGDGNLNISGGVTTFEQFVSFDGGININGKANVTQYGLFESGADFVLEKNATLTFVPYLGYTSINAAGTVDLQGNVKLLGIPSEKEATYFDVIVAGKLDQTQLHSKFDRTWGLNSWLAQFADENDTSMDLFYESITPKDFANRHGLGWNVKEAARAITEIFESTDSWDSLDQYLHSFDNDKDVTDVLDTLRGTEQAADALTIALWDPWTKVYQQLLKHDHLTKPVVRANGQTPDPFKFTNRNVWIEGYYRYTDVNGDHNAKKYYENRGGMMLGLDTKVHHFSTLGIAFGFGDPRLTSQFGKIEADDYTLALYSKTRVMSDAYLNTFFGFGTQEFKYQRNDIFNSIYKSSYDGNALYLSAELLRPVVWDKAWTLYPTAALDYQRSWAYSFQEQGGLFNQSVRKGHMDRFIGRFGVDSKIHYSDYVNILTRLQYGYLIGGDTHASIRSSFTGTSPVMNLRGIDLGRSQFNIGIGGEWFVDEIKCLKFFGNYDIDFGKRYAMQTFQLGVNVHF
jgi:hypothetical protein